MEKFNPSNSKDNNVQGLPKKEVNRFVNVPESDGDGFVRKEANHDAFSQYQDAWRNIWTLFKNPVLIRSAAEKVKDQAGSGMTGNTEAAWYAATGAAAIRALAEREETQGEH